MKGRFNKFITTNPWLKLASLILAIVLWFFVVSKGRSVIVMDVPLEFKNIPAKLEVVDGPKTISIGIEGQERLLKKLRQEDIKVVIDIGNIKKGKTFFQMTQNNVTLPEPLTVTRISPPTIKLTVDEKVRKNVQVRAVTVGSPAEGFSVKEIKVVPKMVEIEGPEGVINRIHTLKTEPIDITDITSSLKYSAYLNIDKENIRVDIPEVEVNITIQRK